MTEAALPIETAGEGKKGNRLNLIILLAASLIVLNALFNHFVASSGPGEMLKVGSKLPDFSVKSADGKIFSNRDFSGKPTLYFFFANWCPCSHISVDIVKQGLAESAGNGLVAFGVGIQDTSENITAFTKRHGLGFAVANSGGDGMATSIGIRTTPTTLLVDANGVIKWIHIGKMDRYDQIEKGLSVLFDHPAKAVSG